MYTVHLSIYLQLHQSASTESRIQGPNPQPLGAQGHTRQEIHGSHSRPKYECSSLPDRWHLYCPL